VALATLPHIGTWNLELRPVANEIGLNVAICPIYRTPLGLSTDAKVTTTKHHIAVLE